MSRPPLVSLPDPPTPYSSSFRLNIPLSLANTISLWAIFCQVKRSAYTGQQRLAAILLPNTEHALHENGANNEAPPVQHPLRHRPFRVFDLILKKGAAGLAVEGLGWVDLEATLETRVVGGRARCQSEGATYASWSPPRLSQAMTKTITFVLIQGVVNFLTNAQIPCTGTAARGISVSSTPTISSQERN